jgi:hypothetical protein
LNAWDVTTRTMRYAAVASARGNGGDIADDFALSETEHDPIFLPKKIHPTVNASTAH